MRGLDEIESTGGVLQDYLQAPSRVPSRKPQSDGFSLDLHWRRRALQGACSAPMFKARQLELLIDDKQILAPPTPRSSGPRSHVRILPPCMPAGTRQSGSARTAGPLAKVRFRPGKNRLATLLASTSDMDSRMRPRQCPRLLIGAINYVFARSMPTVIGIWTATTEKRRITITTAGK